MRAIFQLDLLVAVKRLICNRLNYQLWLGWTWLSNSCQAGQAEALTRQEKSRKRRENKRHLSLYALGQVVKLERTFSYSWAPVVPHQKKSERQSGSRTTCPTCSQAVEAAPPAAAQVVIPPCMKLTSCWCVCRLQAPANSQFPWVASACVWVCVCVSHDLRERLIHVATFALFVCVRGILAKTKHHKSSWVRCWHKEITHKKI